MRLFRVALSLLVLGGLVAAQEQPQASSGPASGQQKSVVYVYRYKQFVGSALAPSVYCDDAQLARMENGRYFAVKVDPGQHTFRSNDAQSGVQLEVKAGQEYFIRVEIATGLMKGHGRLILTAAEQGRYELQSDKLKPLDASKVLDTTRVSVEEVKFDKPAPAPAVTPTAAVAPAPTLKPAVLQHAPDVTDTEHPNSIVLSDSTPDTGNQMSLGDAARKARQQKASANTSTTPPQ